MKTKIAFVVTAVLLLAATMVVFAPPVRAEVNKLLTIASVTLLKTDSGAVLTISGQGESLPFTVMQPEYIPEALRSGLNTFGMGLEGAENFYQAGDQFLAIRQQALQDGAILPEGEAAAVNGQPAALNTGLAGTYQPGPHGDGQGATSVMMESKDKGGTDVNTTSLNTEEDAPGEAGKMVSSSAGPAAFDYLNANQLIFYNGNTKIEILSNLDVQELIKVAEALTPAH